VAAVDHRQKAAGTTRQPDEIEMNETYDAVARLAGIGFVLCGLVFVVRSR
jgi:preprotein translocase subunit Sss1